MSVIFEIQNKIGFATLNRESALNTVNTEMMIALRRTFEAWEKDPEVRAIVLKASGPKAFCAGGDVKSVVEKARSGDFEFGQSFFKNEYAHDLFQYQMKKPLVVVAHGYVMGGGVGLLNGARCRIVTSSTQLSMPEISIGLFPDVGGSYFLNRCTGKLGLFLALTAARLNASDVISAGLADYFIPDMALSEFYELLTSSNEDVPTLCERFSMKYKNEAPASWITQYLYIINEALGKPWQENEPLTAFENLKKLASHPAVSKDQVFQKAIQTFLRGSPTSAHLIWQQLRRGKNLPVEACFEMELTMAKACLREHDFIEGVRAVLIDKDQNPRWNPQTWQDVDHALIEKHFIS